MDAKSSVPLVCVLDDDRSVRRSLERLIRSVGLEVQSFSSVSEFLDGGSSRGASCLVVDVRMPGRSGLDLQELLSNAGWNAPIVFITGHADVPMSVRAMRGGAVDFLQKPFEDEELLESIHQAIARETSARGARSRREDIERHLHTLTPREREVFTLVVEGFPNKRIAARIGASEKTVKVHRARVMAKMRADSLADLVHMAHGAGLIATIAGSADEAAAAPDAATAPPVGPRSNFLLLGASQIFTETASKQRGDERGKQPGRR